MKARDKVHSAIVLQLGHRVTGELDVGVETNTPGPVHHHPCVVDTALGQVLGLSHPLLSRSAPGHQGDEAIEGCLTSIAEMK